jgi:hypothetical protein
MFFKKSLKSNIELHIWLTFMVHTISLLDNTELGLPLENWGTQNLQEDLVEIVAAWKTSS